MRKPVSSAKLAEGGRTCWYFPKAGPASRRGEGQSGWSLRPPTLPLPSASGFAQALRSPEFTVNVVTSGNSQRGRGKGLEEGARTPSPQFPSYQHPPVSSVALSYLSVKRGCPPSGMCP